MRSITIEAKSLGSARGLYNALSEFQPELLVDDEGRAYGVMLELGDSDRRVVDILNALENHVTQQAHGPAHLRVDGRRYTLHAVPAQ